MKKYFLLLLSMSCLQVNGQTWSIVAYNNFDAGVYCFEKFNEELVMSAGYYNERIISWNGYEIDTIPFGLKINSPVF